LSRIASVGSPIASSTRPALSEQIGLSLGERSVASGMHNPFRNFNSSPEVIRLTVMMYVRVAQLTGPAPAHDSLDNTHQNCVVRNPLK
jgi:hypothetical protein